MGAGGGRAADRGTRDWRRPRCRPRSQPARSWSRTLRRAPSTSGRSFTCSISRARRRPSCCSRRAPRRRDGPFAVRDLGSRLKALPVVAIAPPDDALLRAVLVKLFADRQLAVDESLIGYVAMRIERSFAAARSVVARLDEEAMRHKRPLTRALAAELLRCAVASSDAVGTGSPRKTQYRARLTGAQCRGLCDVMSPSSNGGHAAPQMKHSRHG